MTNQNIEGTHEVMIDGVAYPIVGMVVRNQVSVFPGKVTIGDSTRRSHPLRSIWAQSDWSGGIGVHHMRGEQFVDRVWWSTLNLSHRGHMVLSPRADDVPKPTGAGEIKGFGQLAGDLYAVFGSKVYRYDGASWSDSLHTLKGSFNDLAHIDIDGEDYLVISHEEGVAYTTDGDSWTDTGIVELGPRWPTEIASRGGSFHALHARQRLAPTAGLPIDDTYAYRRGHASDDEGLRLPVVGWGETVQQELKFLRTDSGNEYPRGIGL